MKIEYERESARFPICWDCQEPIIFEEKYYRIPWAKAGVRFYHADCFEAYHAEYMSEGGAE